MIEDYLPILSFAVSVCPAGFQIKATFFVKNKIN